MTLPAMDFETYSEAGYLFDESCGYFKPLLKGKPGLMGVNAPVYAEHPTARVISLAYNLNDGCGVRLWTPVNTAGPAPLFHYLHSGGLIEAHNSGFEYYIWFYVCQQRMGWPELPLHQLRCSAAKARAWGLPGALEKVSSIVTPGRGKDPRGKKLIQLLSIPKKPTKACSELFRSFEKYPELHYEMFEYNDQDVVAEQDVSSRMPEMSEFETQVWLIDQEINTRGVAIDLEGLEACVRLFHAASNKYTAELQQITGGEVQTVDEVSKGSAGDKWFQSRGFKFPSLDKQTVVDSLERADLPSDVRRVLEIRQAIGGAAVKKLFAMQRCLNSDGRIRDSFVYCGAERTGRWAGRQIQPQNFRNGGPEEDGMEWGNTLAERALVDIHTGDLEQIEGRWGSSLDLIGSCMRSLLVAGPGKELICSDYSAIEAVVLAALSGEEWRLEVFRTHGKIYEASISMITGVPLEEILAHKKETGKHHPLRKKGKISELGSGFGGWINAWKNFGAGSWMTDEEIKNSILEWRRASPAIVEFWGGQWRKVMGRWEFYREFYGIEGMTVLAIANPGTEYAYRDIKFGVFGDVLYIRLPSGRCLSYHEPRLNVGTDPRGQEVQQISYMGMDGYTHKWCRIQTYGSKLAENCVAGDAEVLTPEGWIRLDAYRKEVPVWDGVEFVYGYKLLDKGIKSIVEYSTIKITPDHLVLCSDNKWRSVYEITSSCGGFNRKEVHVPNSNRVLTQRWKKELVEGTLRLWKRVSGKGFRTDDDKMAPNPKVLRVHDKRNYRNEEYVSRNDRPSCVSGMEIHEGQVPTKQPSCFQELWRTRNKSLRRVVAFFQSFLEGHGEWVCAGTNSGQAGQQQGLFKRELPVGKPSSPGEQPKRERNSAHQMGENGRVSSIQKIRDKCDYHPVSDRCGLAGRQTVHKAGFPQQVRVFDIANCGPRNRFVVRGRDGSMMIVHNCTQAAARDIMASALLRVNAAGYPPVLHVHDEIVSEVPIGFGSVEEFEQLMEVREPWFADWPISASGGWRGHRYRK